MGTYSHELVHLDKNNILNEAYIGKTPILLEIEKKFGELRKDLSRTKAISSSKTMLEINRLFEKQFGMEVFAINVVNTDEANAWTLTIARHIDMNYSNMRDYVTGNMKTGFRYRKGNGLSVLVNITYGLLADERMSDGDIVAVILHEVGHNFSCCLHNDIILYNQKLMDSYRAYLIADCIYRAIIGVIFLPTLPIAAYKIYKNITSLSMKEEKRKSKKNNAKPRRKYISSFLAGVKGTIGDKFNTVASVIDRYTGHTARIANFYKSQVSDEQKAELKNSINRQDEIFADKFAATYGYGVELSNFELIFSDIVNGKAYKATRKLGEKAKIMNDIYEESLFDMADFDEHPNALQRVINTLNTLQREFDKDDVDPKIKEDIKFQIDTIKSIIEDMTDVTSKHYRIEKAQAAYFNYVKDNEPDGVSKEINDAIDEILDSALEEQYKKRRK